MHSATPARGAPSARDSERIRLSLSSEGMQRGPFLRRRVSHGSRFHREGPIKVKDKIWLWWSLPTGQRIQVGRSSARVEVRWLRVAGG